MKEKKSPAITEFIVQFSIDFEDIGRLLFGAAMSFWEGLNNKKRKEIFKVLQYVCTRQGALMANDPARFVQWCEDYPGTITASLKEWKKNMDKPLRIWKIYHFEEVEADLRIFGGEFLKTWVDANEEQRAACWDALANHYKQCFAIPLVDATGKTTSEFCDDMKEIMSRVLTDRR